MMDCNQLGLPNHPHCRDICFNILQFPLKIAFENIDKQDSMR